MVFVNEYCRQNKTPKNCEGKGKNKKHFGETPTSESYLILNKKTTTLKKCLTKVQACNFIWCAEKNLRVFEIVDCGG